MGDMGDYWRDVKPGLAERSKQKRASNREHSARLLREAGIQFESKNEGAHLIVCGTVDFWPGTGLWQVRSVPRQRRGVRSLIKHIKESQ